MQAPSVRDQEVAGSNPVTPTVLEELPSQEALRVMAKRLNELAVWLMEINNAVIDLQKQNKDLDDRLRFT